MSTQDTCCTIVRYFEVPSENLSDFKALCERFVEKAKEETKCLYYGFSFCGNKAHCREGYQDADGILEHLSNVGGLLKEMLQIAKVSRLEVHGPKGELSKLEGPLAELKPDFYALEYGFRN